MIYLDSSALIKLVLNEPESDALTAWLTSGLSRVEVVRACRRANEDHLPAARRLLAGLQFVPMTLLLLEQAAMLRPPTLRSLDAFHLASALSIRSELTAFVAYDRRLQAAAEAERLPVVAPA